ncbi:MAG: TlpA family protein disulfide reductase [Candidatus Limnocylindria bacterium]|jgi:thiol-disulfide isomerase/thioredoxin
MGFRRLLVCAGALALLGAGPPAPISLQTLDGDEALILRGSEGPDWVLHFWASWCPECTDELPALARAARACDPARVRVVAVNVAEAPDLVRRYLAEHSIDLPVLLDPRGTARRDAGLWGLPANLWWTRDGVVSSEGASREKEWRRSLGELGCGKAAP